MSSSHYQPRNVLVTGGAGFIGSNFIRLWQKLNATINIINLDLLTYAANIMDLEALKDPSRYYFVHGDIRDAALVNDLLARFEVDTIVHFAAESHVDRSIIGPSPFINTNVVGTFVLLEAAKGYWLHKKKWDALQCRFHHISTDEVYGSLKLDEPAFTELSPYDPRSPYSASKAGSDHLVRAYYHTYGLPVTLSHCSNNYGPYQHAEKMIPTLIRNALEGKPLPIYGKGENIRDWLFVDDHVRGILAILERGHVGETYHLGGECELSNVVLAKRVCDVLDRLYPSSQPYAQWIEFVKDRAGHDFRYAMNISKINKALGWFPRVPFKEGIEKTVRFYAREQVPEIA